MKYLLTFLFLLFPSVAAACSFSAEADIFKPQGEIVANYEYAFVGYLGERQEKGDDQFYGADYELTVTKVYKGSVEPGTVFSLESAGHSCGFFGEGNQYGSFLYAEEINYIDETTPKQLFDTEAEAIAYADAQFMVGPTEPENNPGENQDKNEEQVTNPVDENGNPLFGPEVGFVEPTTQPPYDNTPEFDREKPGLWERIVGFFRSFFANF